MSFPRYPEYKESGVEWLGPVPTHWSACALNHRFDIALGKMLDEKRISGEHLAPYLRNVDVQWGRINTEDLPQMDFRDDDLVRYSLNPGDLLVCEGGEVGRAAIWEGQLRVCYYQKALHRIRPRHSLAGSARFLFFVFSAAAKLGIFSGAEGRATIAHLTAEALRRYVFPFPPLDEQLAIATFLDRETAKIDALIAEQQRLIELLNEKRQAVISHAVTKGLNPDAPMKDSGIEWLGEVPAHWDVFVLSRVVAKIEQGWSPTADSEPCSEGEWGVLKLSAIKRGTFVAGENKALLPGTVPDPSIEVREGDLLITRANTPELVGDACVARGLGERRLMLSDLVYRLSLCDGHEPDFFCNLLISGFGRSQIEADARGSSMSMAKVSQGHIKGWWVPVPPAEEQRKIAAHIAAASLQLNSLINEAGEAVRLLQERRTALISAAVTGKIDVRRLAATGEPTNIAEAAA